MIFAHDAVRQHLLDNLGFPRTLEYRHIPDLDVLKRMKWNADFWTVVYYRFVDWLYYAKRPLEDEQARGVKDFEQYMRNRLILGTFRYRVWEGDRNPHDYPGEMRARAHRYVEDGNLEHFVDIANFALVEYTMCPDAPSDERVFTRGPLIPIVRIESNVHIYETTGNRDALVAVAMWALLGYTFSQHPKRHFGATDGSWHPPEHPDGSQS